MMVPPDIRRIIRAAVGMVAGSASVAAQAGFAGADYGLGTIGDLQLEKDVGDVISDGLDAQVEATCDVHVGHAVGDQVQYLGLPGGKLGEGQGKRDGPGAGEEAHDPGRYLRPNSAAVTKPSSPLRAMAECGTFSAWATVSTTFSSATSGASALSRRSPRRERTA